MMRKIPVQSVRLLIPTVVLMASFSCTTVANSSSFPSSGKFDQVTTIIAPRLKVAFVQSICFKAGNIRVDKTDLSEFIPLTQIETPDAMYLYSSLAGSGQESPITQKLPPLLDRMDSDTKSKLEGATKSGTDTFEGFSCDIYKTSDQNGAEQIEFWVSKDPNFPFTIKTVATDRSLNKVTTVDLENIVLNVKLDDSVFQVPQSIKIVEVKPSDQATAPPMPVQASPDSASQKP